MRKSLFSVHSRSCFKAVWSKKKDTMDAKCAVTGRMCVTFNLFTQDEPDFFSLLITNYNNAEGTTK